VRGGGWISLRLKKPPLGVWSAPRRVGFLEPYLVSTGEVVHGVGCLDPRPRGLDVTWIPCNLDTQSWRCFPHITVPSGKPTISQSWGKLSSPPPAPRQNPTERRVLALGLEENRGPGRRPNERPRPQHTHTHTHTHTHSLGIQGPPENCTLEVSRRFHPDLQTRRVRTDPLTASRTLAICPNFCRQEPTAGGGGDPTTCCALTESDRKDSKFGINTPVRVASRQRPPGLGRQGPGGGVRGSRSKPFPPRGLY